MAKYRITSLPGYTKRIPLSKAQFGGLQKFLPGGASSQPCYSGFYWNGTNCVPVPRGVNPLGQSAINNFLSNTTTGVNAEIEAVKKQGMVYQHVADQLKPLYAKKAKIAESDKKYNQQLEKEKLAKQKLLEQERKAKMNPNAYYSETIQEVARNSGGLKTQQEWDRIAEAKKLYNQKRMVITDDYLYTHHDALVHEAARSIQNSSPNLTYDQALAKAEQDEALLYKLAEKHTPTEGSHVNNLAKKLDFYDYKNSRNDQIKSIDPNDPTHISFEDPGTVGGYLDHVKNIVKNPLDATGYAFSDKTMPFNYDEYEEMKKRTGYRDDNDDNVVLQGIDFASYFHPVGLYGQGMKMIEPTAKSIVNVYNNPTWENAGTAAFDIGMTGLTFLGAKNPLKFLAEEKFAADASTAFRNWNPAQTGSTPPFNTGTGLLPVGVATEVRAASEAATGTTPLLNINAIGFNPTTSLDNISSNNRSALSRFIPEQNITREPTLFDTETDLFLNQRPPTEYITDINQVPLNPETAAIDAYDNALAEAQAAHQEWRSSGTPEAALRLNQADSRYNLARQNLQIEAPNYVAQVGNLSSTQLVPATAAERTTIANDAITRSQGQTIEDHERARVNHYFAQSDYNQDPTNAYYVSQLRTAERELAIAEENVSILSSNYEPQPPVNNAAPTSSTASSSTPSKEEAIDSYEAARAEQQAATETYNRNSYRGDVNTYILNWRRLSNADEALRIAEQDLALVAPDYISQPYVPPSANLNATTGPIMSGSLSSGNANLNSGAISSAALPGTANLNTGTANLNSGAVSSARLPPQSTAFDGLSGSLGTSPTKGINYSSTTIDALTQSRPRNYFHNGQTVETQLSNLTDPVDYANRLRELHVEGAINRTAYDELSQGLTAHLNNASNPSIRNDVALDIINVDPNALYTGSNLSEVAAQNLIDRIPSYELDDALGYYGYNKTDIERFFADANLSDDVRRVAYNQIKDDYRYMADFNIFNPNTRPIDFATGQITSPALKKTNTISDYKTLKISKKSKDVLAKTMYKDLDLSTGSVSFLGTESKTVHNIRDKANLVSNKDLNKQLEAYEEAYAVVKEKGGFAESLIRNKLEDLKGTKYLRTTYADQMRAAGKDPSEIMECSIITDADGAKSLIDKDGTVLGTVTFHKGTWMGEEYSEIGATGLKLKYHSHSLKHSTVKTWDQAEKVLTKRYLDELLETVDKANRKNPVVVKHFTRQAEVKAADQIKQLQINNNNKFGEALYAGTNAALKDTRGRLGTRESFSHTNLPDQVTGVRISRPRAENAWRSWGKQYYEGVPRARYVQGPSKDPYNYQNKTENFLNAPNFILRKLGGDVSKLSKFTQ